MRSVFLSIFLAGAAAPLSAQVTHHVDVGPNFLAAFSPKNIVIQVGDTVQWDWVSGVHNVHSTDGYFLSGAPVAPPMSFSVTFDAAFLAGAPISSNRYEYQCDVHAALGMTGSVTVQTPGKPVLTVTDPAPGATVTITVDGATPNGSVVVAYSTQGGGPINTPFGVASLSPPVKQLPPVQANAVGSARMTLNVPATTPIGLTVWNQALDVGSGTLSNGARVIV